MCMKENKKEVYDFMADARASIHGLIQRMDYKEDDSEERVLITIALDFSTGDILHTAHGKESAIAAALAMYMRRCKIEGKVKRSLELFDEEGIKFPEETEND